MCSMLQQMFLGEGCEENTLRISGCGTTNNGGDVFILIEVDNRALMLVSLPFDL